MRTAKVSVIVPVYNCRKYLERCIDSLLKQTYEQLEILLIDDGSSDGSEKICDEYALKDERIQVFHVQNSGVGNARNMGLGKASGDYIGFVDADDWVSPKMYEVLVHNLEKYDCEISTCKYRQVDRSQIPEEEKKKETVIVYSGKKAEEKLLEGGSSVVWNGLYKKKFLEELRFENLSIGEDAVFLMECYERLGERGIAAETDRTLYYWFQRPGSARKSRFQKKKLDALKSAEKIVGIVSKNQKDLLKKAYALEFSYYMGILAQIYAGGQQKQYRVEITEIAEKLKENKKRMDKSCVGRGKKYAYVLYRISPKIFAGVMRVYYERGLFS